MTQINRSSYTPLYYQLSELIGEQIDSGELSPGATILSENELGKKYEFSRNTIKQAIAKPVNEGILFRQ